jgi:transposase-like protein
MEKSSKRGKIPQSDWPLIMARYEAGETLSSIARTYDCSPPAISYVVSRSRARGSAAPPPPTAASAEPQLVKSSAGNAVAASNGSAAPGAVTAGATALSLEASANGTAAQQKSASDIFGDPRGDIWRREANGHRGNGSAVATPPPRHPAPPMATTSVHSGPANGDHRPKLHLTLGNGSQPEGAAQQTNPHPVERHPQALHQPQHGGNGRSDPLAHASAPNGRTAFDQHRPAVSAGSFEPAHRPLPLPQARHEANGGAKEGSGSYIDHDLRARVDGDIAAFLAAFDAALAQDTQESRSALREATDRLLRAGARTRIELERLEARMPLPRRDATFQGEAGWRPRQ